jgi:protein CpxP
MRNSGRHMLITTTAIIGLSLFSAAAAPPGAGDPTKDPNAPRPPASAGVGTHLEATIDQRITDLHDKLQISAPQRSQWDQFAGVMRDNAKNMDQTFQTRVQMMPTMTAAENMQSYAKISEQHAQDMQKLVVAFQTLYNSMSDSQKRTADQVFRDDASSGHSSGHS